MLRALLTQLVPPQLLAELSEAELVELEGVLAADVAGSKRVQDLLRPRARAALRALRSSVDPRRYQPWYGRAFFSLDGLPIIEALKESWRAIRDEYRALARTRPGLDGPYPLPIYQGDWFMGCLRTDAVEHDYMPPELIRRTVEAFLPRRTVARMTQRELRDKYCELFEASEAQNRALCPVLSGLLDPLYPRSVKVYTFNVMRPGVRLQPHRGTDAGNIRVHLCLEQAAGCWLKVNDEYRTWREGEVWAFDDHDLHSAAHEGTGDRAILLVDFTKSYLSSELKALDSPASAPSSAAASARRGAGARRRAGRDRRDRR